MRNKATGGKGDESMQQDTVKKINVAIITPFSTGNIGTVLQAYATQVMVERCGYQNAIVHYIWDAIENPFLLKNLKQHGIKGYLAAIAGHLTRLPKRRGLLSFIERFTLTQKLKKSELPSLQTVYDFFIVGSDCVWNASGFGLETPYLLDFVSEDARKGNYASSFAEDDVPAEYRALYSDYLSRFERLSVREERGVELIRELTGKEATLVLDPTLALPAEFWSVIADESTIGLPKRYLFVAEYAISPQMWKDAKKLAQKENLEIVCTFPPKGGRAKAHHFNSASPQDFLKIIRNATYVLTDSYHMTIFSINFGVPFFSYITNTALPTYSKYRSILHTLGIDGRVTFENKEERSYVDVLSATPLDHERIHARLADMRTTSTRYLQTLLDDANRLLCPTQADDKHAD